MTIKKICIETLKKNSTKSGFTAGTTHFNDVWARDALYASWGAILQKNFRETVKNTLNTLIFYQRDGQIPLRVGRKNMLLAFLRLPSRKGGVYTNDKSQSPALDPNTLYVITLQKYLEKTKDKKMKERHLPHVHEAMDWLSQKEHPIGLLSEDAYAGWDDSIRKKGASTYNNVLYYAALIAATNITGDKAYVHKAQKVRKAMNKYLWSEHYYLSWVGKDVMELPGNLLAIIFGLTNTTQKKRILRTIDFYKEEYGDVLPSTNYPQYDRGDVYHPFHLINMADYHNMGPYWTWIAALEIYARRKCGQKKRSEKIFDEIQRIILPSKTIYEIYYESGVPFKRFFYRSEKDFCWAAGMLFLAIMDRS